MLPNRSISVRKACMLRSTAALLAVCSFPSTTQGATSHAGKRAGPNVMLTGFAVAQRLHFVLERQRHLEARGYLIGPGLLRTRYLIRFQAPNREYLSESGGSWTQVQIPHREPAGFRAVYIGKQAYTSTNGSTWIAGMRQSAPDPVDLLSVNMARAPCCAAGPPQSASQLWNLGLTTWHGSRAYRLKYLCEGNGIAVRGSALIDTTTFLPLLYTESSESPHVSGRFVLSYDGAFSITAPRQPLMGGYFNSTPNLRTVRR